MNLVVGATGILGGRICHHLAQARQPVRALVRSTSAPERVEALQDLGAELALGDLKDPESLEAACAGAHAVISTASTTLSRQPDDSIGAVDEQGQLALVEAARGAGVERFIYVSYSGNIDIDCPLHTAKRTVEAQVRDSGMTYTILRPSVFMEVWLSPELGFDYAEGRARIYGSGINPVSFVSLEDVATFAAACVDNPSADDQVIELGGPEALSPIEVVRIFEEVAGRGFHIEHLHEDALLEQWSTAEDPLQKSFAALMLGLARGDAIDMEATLRDFPVEMTTVRDYARRVLGDSVRSAPSRVGG